MKWGGKKQRLVNQISTSSNGNEGIVLIVHVVAAKVMGFSYCERREREWRMQTDVRREWSNLSSLIDLLY